MARPYSIDLRERVLSAVGVTQKTAWLLAQKVREGWIDGSEKLASEVEVDETCAGAIEKKNKGTYCQMSPKRVSRYVTEFAGRHNVRGFDTIIQMTMLAKGLDGKRLRYDDLVARL